MPNVLHRKEDMGQVNEAERKINGVKQIKISLLFSKTNYDSMS